MKQEELDALEEAGVGPTVDEDGNDIESEVFAPKKNTGAEGKPPCKCPGTVNNPT